jgi:hypothetical protein
MAAELLPVVRDHDHESATRKPETVESPPERAHIGVRPPDVAVVEGFVPPLPVAGARVVTAQEALVEVRGMGFVGVEEQEERLVAAAFEPVEGLLEDVDGASVRLVVRRDVLAEATRIAHGKGEVAGAGERGGQDAPGGKDLG